MLNCVISMLSVEIVICYMRIFQCLQRVFVCCRAGFWRLKRCTSVNEVSDFFRHPEPATCILNVRVIYYQFMSQRISDMPLAGVTYIALDWHKSLMSLQWGPIIFILQKIVKNGPIRIKLQQQFVSGVTYITYISLWRVSPVGNLIVL